MNIVPQTKQQIQVCFEMNVKKNMVFGDFGLLQ